MANLSQIKLPNGTTYNIVDKTSGYTKNTGTITQVKTTAGAHTTIDVSSGAATFNVPTKTSHLTNDSGFITNAGVTGVKGNAESSYRTGQVNLTAANINAYEILPFQRGTIDVSIRPLISRARANRLAFLPPSQVIIEKTIDGGTTWTDAGYTDAQKIGLFATSGSIVIPLLNNAKSELCGLRVTITGMRYDVPNGTSEVNKYSYWNSEHILSQERYFNVREWWFWLSSNNDTIQCEIQAATGANSTNWRNIFNSEFHMTGWSGSDWIRAGSGATFGGGTTQTGNYWNWRLIFWSRKADNKDTFQSATAQSINMIQCYGDSVWGTPNSLMSNDHLYNYDNSQNATFPAKVTATSFSGNLTGNVTGNVSGSAGSVAWTGVTGKPSSTGNSTTGISIAAHGTGTVIGVQSTTTTASKVTVGSSSTDYGVKSAGSASTWTFEEKTIPNVTAAGSGSASLTFTMDTTDTKKLKITFSHTHTAPTIGTAIKVQSKSGGANSTAPTLGSKVPTVSASDVTVPIKNASASTFVTGTTHTVTDNGHTHSI